MAQGTHILTIPPFICTRGKVISRVCLPTSVCLSVDINTTSSPDSGQSITAKYFPTVRSLEKLRCLCFFLLKTLYKHLKCCVWVGIYKHAYWSHREIPVCLQSKPEPWPHVNVKILHSDKFKTGCTEAKHSLQELHIGNQQVMNYA